MKYVYRPVQVPGKIEKAVFTSMEVLSLVPSAREKRRSGWYTLFAHAFNLPKMWGLRAIF